MVLMHGLGHLLGLGHIALGECCADLAQGAVGVYGFAIGRECSIIFFGGIQIARLDVAEQRLHALFALLPLCTGGAHRAY